MNEARDLRRDRNYLFSKKDKNITKHPQMRAATLRINKELQLLQKSPHQIIPDETNILNLTCVIDGPPNTPYEGGKFVVKVVLPPEYPFRYPKAKFETKVYHPNVSTSGEICLESIQKTWSTKKLISDLLDFIVTILANPNVDNPLSADVAFIYQTNQERFKEMAKEWTQNYAK